ncbi:hypothetical protein TWF281_004176 [Arthrobotrys megalospora]
MDNRPFRCLGEPQRRFLVVLLIIFSFYSESVAAWQQLNLFKDRRNWWNRPDISVPTDIMVHETRGFTCTVAGRPAADTILDVTVIWNRPEPRGTVVRAVAFYDDNNCGTVPDPITGQLPPPSVILVLDLDRPNAISVYNFATADIKFTWGSYGAFDLAGARNPKGILHQFMGQDLSGTVIQRDPESTTGDKLYKTPMKILQTYNAERFQYLTQTAGVNALLRHIAETSLVPLLPEQYRTSGLVENMSRILMTQINQYIAEEEARARNLRQQLLSTSAAVNGASEAIMGMSGGRIQGPSLPQGGQSNPDVGRQQGGSNPSSFQMPSYQTDARSVSNFQAPNSNSNVPQMYGSYGNPRNNPLLGGRLYPTYNADTQLGQSLQDTVPQSSTQQGGLSQQYSPHVNIPPQGSNPGSSIPHSNIPPTSMPQGQNVYSNVGGGYPVGGNTNTLPRLPPIPLHPELLNALARGDDPQAFGGRPPDTSAILQSYYREPNSRRWMNMFIAMERSFLAAFQVARQVYDLGERGLIPRRPPQTQGIPQEGQRNEGGQVEEELQQQQNMPSMNEIPQTGGLSNTNQQAPLDQSQQQTGQDLSFNTGNHPPGRMQIEIPEQELRRENQPMNSGPPAQLGPDYSLGGRPSSQIQFEPPTSETQIEFQPQGTGSRGQPGIGQLMQPQTEDIPPARSDAGVLRIGPLNVGPGSELQRLSTPGVFKIGVPQTGDQARPEVVQTVAQPATIERVPPSSTGSNRNDRAPGSQNQAPIEREGPANRDLLQPLTNNVQWLQQQKNPFGRLPVPSEQVPQSRSQGNTLPSAQSFSENRPGLENPATGQQVGQNNVQDVTGYIPSPDTLFPDWDDEIPARDEPEIATAPSNPFSITLRNDPNRGLRVAERNDNNPDTEQSIQNIPAMFQRAPSPRRSNIAQEEDESPQSNQRNFYRPSIGQLRPSRGTSAQTVPNTAQQRTGIARTMTPAMESEEPSLRDETETEEEGDVEGDEEWDPEGEEEEEEEEEEEWEEEEVTPVSGRDEPEEEEAAQSPNIERQEAEDPSIGSEVVELPDRPNVFDRNRNASPGIDLFEFSEEVGSPASVQSVIDELEGVPQDMAQPSRIVAEQRNLASYPNLVSPELQREDDVGREYSDMVRDLIWGKPSPSERIPQPLFPGAGQQAGNRDNRRLEDLTSPELLRPPPMRTSQNTQNPAPREDPTLLRLSPQHKYANLLGQLQRLDRSQQQPTAAKIPGYITPSFLRPNTEDPIVTPFLEEDDTPLRPLEMLLSLNRDLTPQQAWDQEHKYMDPMLDRDLARQMLQEERDRRAKELNDNPTMAWRDMLKSMAKFQQQGRLRPDDIPYWAGPPFLSQETGSALDRSRIMTAEELDAANNPQDYDWDWDEAENTLVSRKKRKLNPLYPPR